MLKPVIGALALSALATGAFAEGWEISSAESKIAFGSIKNNTTGEVHHFEGVSGTVSEAGAVAIAIDVLGVETWIDIRNERMLEHVFESEAYPKATITGQVDMGSLSDLVPGETATTAVEGTLGLAGAEVPVTAELFVAALGEDRVLVTTDEMIMLHADEAGIEEGLEALRDIAGLDSIARVSPVTLRLVFQRKDKAS